MWVYVYVHVYVHVYIYVYVYVYGTLRHGVLHCTTSHPSGVVLASVSPTGSSSQAAAHAVRDMRHTSTCDYTNYSITAPRRWGRCGRRCTARSRWPASTASRGAKRITSSSPASAPTSIRYAVVFSRILFVFSRILSYSFVSPGLFTVDSSRAAPPTTRHVAAPAAKHLVRAAASCLHQHAAAAILCPCLPSAMNLFTPAKPEHVMPVVLALRHRQPNWGAVSPPTQPGWVPATVCPRPVPIVFGRTKLPPTKLSSSSHQLFQSHWCNSRRAPTACRTRSDRISAPDPACLEFLDAHILSDPISFHHLSSRSNCTAGHRLPVGPAPAERGADARAAGRRGAGQPASAVQERTLERFTVPLPGGGRAGGGSPVQPEAEPGAAVAPHAGALPVTVASAFHSTRRVPVCHRMSSRFNQDA